MPAVSGFRYTTSSAAPGSGPWSNTAFLLWWYRLRLSADGDPELARVL